jgi:hypothetical protein
MLQFQGREVFFQLPYVEEVSCEPGLVAATFPADLLDDQLGVPLHEELADPQGGGRQAEDQCFVICHIVGGLELKVHHVLHLISIGVDEDHPSSVNLLTGGSIEEERPVGLGEDQTPGLRRCGVRIGI